jgi:hypothetical protein
VTGEIGESGELTDEHRHLMNIIGRVLRTVFEALAVPTATSQVQPHWNRRLLPGAVGELPRHTTDEQTD